MPKKLTRNFGAGVAGLALTACAYTPALVPSPEGGNEPPALDAQRILRVANQADAAAKAGDEGKDLQKMAPRFSNPALAMRGGEYQVVNTTPGAKLAALPLADPQVTVVEKAKEWPRYAYTVSPSVEGQPIYVFGFVQSQPRANYTVWGYVKLFPKASFPATFKPEVGSPEIVPDAAEFRAKPGSLARSYTDLLNDGGNPAKDIFNTENDSFFATFNQRKSDYAQLVQQSRGLEISLAARPGSDGFLALGTTEGGALVMASLQYDLVMKSQRPLDLSPLAKAMTGKNRATSTLTETHTVVALFDLPATKDGKVTALGASDAVTAINVD